MGYYDITNDLYEIISGESNKYSKAYTEAVKKTKDSNSAKKALKAFIKSISKVKNTKKSDKLIDESAGNIKQFSRYQDITAAFDFLKKESFKSSFLTDLQSLHDSIVKYTSEYTTGYEKQVFLTMNEYHQAVYLLSTGLLIILSRDIDIEIDDKGTVKCVSKSDNSKQLAQWSDIISKYSAQLKQSNHKKYLQQLNNEKDKVEVNTNINEGAVADFFDAATSIFNIAGNIVSGGVNLFVYVKNTVFGIVPLIRSVVFLKYKAKADTIVSLQNQIASLEQNINRLENKTAMDPKKKEVIVKKQRAYIEAYKKKAAKLLAELTEGEKDAAVALKEDNKKIEQETKDDDIVVENAELYDYINNYREE